MLPLLADQLHLLEKHFSAQSARQFGGMLAAEVKLDDLRCGYLTLVRELYERAYAGGPIVDKTPSFDAVRTIPFARAVFPDCRIVFCYRRALENVASRLRKWPNVSFANHCLEWTTIMASWREIKQTLPANCYIEVEQLDIVRKPESVADALVNLIGSDIRHASLYEDLGLERSMIDGSEVGRIQSLETTDWSNDQRATFTRICGEELKQWGYSIDERYTSLDQG